MQEVPRPREGRTAPPTLCGPRTEKGSQHCQLTSEQSSPKRRLVSSHPCPPPRGPWPPQSSVRAPRRQREPGPQRGLRTEPPARRQAPARAAPPVTLGQMEGSGCANTPGPRRGRSQGTEMLLGPIPRTPGEPWWHLAGRLLTPCGENSKPLSPRSHHREGRASRAASM